jgi:hypothetical protein
LSTAAPIQKIQNTIIKIMKIDRSCFAEGAIVVGGVSIELPVQFSSDRGTAAGRFRVPSTGAKGSIVMIRIP